MPSHQKNASTTTERNVLNGMYSDDLKSMMQELLRTLSNIDLQHASELDRLDRSATDKELKQHIKSKIRARHHERREPYVALLSELRLHQVNLSLVA
jgi:hypothetical protein